MKLFNTHKMVLKFKKLGKQLNFIVDQQSKEYYYLSLFPFISTSV